MKNARGLLSWRALGDPAGGRGVNRIFCGICRPMGETCVSDVALEELKCFRSRRYF